jgi:hypothetical protein
MRSYLFVLAAAAVFTIVVTSLASWMFDPYGISHPLAGKLLMAPNDRAAKIAFLAHNCRHFDSYIVGNSRTQILSSNDLGGGRYYNLGAPLDEVGQSLERLKLLFRIGCPVSVIVAGESVDVLAQPNPASLQQTENPLISGEGWLPFYTKYFLGPQGAIAYLRAQLVPTSRPMVYYPDGHLDSLWEMQSDADYSLPICAISPPSEQDKEELLRRLALYRELAALASQYGAKVIVWLTPLSKARRAALDDPDVHSYLEKLRQIPGLSVFEADRNSPLLSDFHQWHDCSHFHRAVFDQLVAPGVIRMLQR